MTRSRTAMAGAAALGAAVLVFVGAVLPPRARRLAPPGWQTVAPVVRGVFHVHTIRSDGTGTVDEVAAAAARAGLQFVVFTDHGNGMRQPDPPRYRSGVLCLDGVEITTTGGHYAAVGLRQAPYPLGGDPRDVVEDVHRLGGIGIVTHPDSVKPALAWRGGDLPFEGMEWLNADSQWRDKSVARLAVAVLTYPFRPEETVASLFHRPATLARWDALLRERPVLGIAGSDAHARVGWKNQGDPYDDRTLVKLPSYDATFRAFSVCAVLDARLSGQATADAQALLHAIRARHLHAIVDAYARPGVFEFTGRTAGADRVLEGETTPLADVLLLRVRTNAPAGTRLVLYRDGREVQRVAAPEMTYATNRTGSYRAEAWLPGLADPAMPWAVSNAITAVDSRSTPVVAAPPPVPAGTLVATLDPSTGWSVEHEAASSGETACDGRETVLDYRLGPAARGSQFVALSHPLTLPGGASTIAFTGVASAPMRVSVQLRAPKDRDGERWARSVYLDGTPRTVVVPLADMRPAGQTSSAQPPVAKINSLLFVVDRVHAVAGAAGKFSVSSVKILAR